MTETLGLNMCTTRGEGANSMRLKPRSNVRARKSEGSRVASRASDVPF